MSKKIRLSHASYGRALWPAVGGTMLMTIAVLVVRLALSNQFSTPMRLLIEVATGAAVYSFTILSLHGNRVAVFRRTFGLIRG
ncbi:MAG: hypothetical protein JO187_12005 [Acidobacteria bacterium]|nr:hypothetical protein [Acidobacteriota bacterium]